MEDRLWCPYHHDSVKPRWDEEDPAVAWCPACGRTIATVNSRSPERIAEVAEPLFASAVAQGMHAPFALDADYWGREWAERLTEALAEDGRASSKTAR
jgi:hypothetical protein